MNPITDLRVLRVSAAHYVRAKDIMAELRARRKEGALAEKDYVELRAQALAGDIDGATRALWEILSRGE